MVITEPGRRRHLHQVMLRRASVGVADLRYVALEPRQVVPAPVDPVRHHAHPADRTVSFDHARDDVAQIPHRRRSRSPHDSWGCRSSRRGEHSRWSWSSPGDTPSAAASRHTDSSNLAVLTSDSKASMVNHACPSDPRSRGFTRWSVSRTSSGRTVRSARPSKQRQPLLQDTGTQHHLVTICQASLMRPQAQVENVPEAHPLRCPGHLAAVSPDELEYPGSEPSTAPADSATAAATPPAPGAGDRSYGGGHASGGGRRRAASARTHQAQQSGAQGPSAEARRPRRPSDRDIARRAARRCPRARLALVRVALRPPLRRGDRIVGHLARREHGGRFGAPWVALRARQAPRLRAGRAPRPPARRHLRRPRLRQGVRADAGGPGRLPDRQGRGVLSRAVRNQPSQPRPVPAQQRPGVHLDGAVPGRGGTRTRGRRPRLLPLQPVRRGGPRGGARQHRGVVARTEPAGPRRLPRGPPPRGGRGPR